MEQHDLMKRQSGTCGTKFVAYWSNSTKEQMASLLRQVVFVCLRGPKPLLSQACLRVLCMIASLLCMVLFSLLCGWLPR